MKLAERSDCMQNKLYAIYTSSVSRHINIRLGWDTIIFFMVAAEDKTLCIVECGADL
jgi:hypothetical protein